MNDIDGFGPDALVDMVPVSRETLSRIVAIVEALEVWRLKTNLIGPNERSHLWRRHILDSLQLAPLLPKTGGVLDLGSGAGFPGLVLSAVRHVPDGPVTMVESVGKKCAFLRAAIATADLNGRVRQARVEAVTDVSAVAVTARAFAPLPRLLDYAAVWLEQGTVGVFPKGRRWQEELTEAQNYWTFKHEIIPSLTSEDGVILRLSEVSRVNE